MAVKNQISRSINASILAGVLIAASLIALLTLPELKGPNTPLFLMIFFLASGGYIIAVLRLSQDHLTSKMIFGMAIIYRVTLLFTEPSLSDDVYRYVWDGHLLNQGINPYAYPVKSSYLDVVDIPFRSLVNHNWMASPYLPASQLNFVIVAFLFPQKVLPFQVASVMFDLLTGLLLLDILKNVELSPRLVLVYLWNPLVILEFSHGAHIDALMIFLMMLAFWFLVKSTWQNRNGSIGSVAALAAATLTKFIPILLAPIFWWRWTWKQRALFGILLVAALAIFIPGAGLGLFGPLDGTGVFGALRIYLQKWNYNGGIYHWLEVLISGYPTPGAVPIDVVGVTPIYITKIITTLALGCVVLIVSWLAWKSENNNQQPHKSNLQKLNCNEVTLLKDRNIRLIRLSLLPLGAFLIFSATIHPWYVTLIIPLLPFLFPKNAEKPSLKPFIWPWIYFSIIVTLSYLTYLDPDNLRETTWVRLVEYIPFYFLLGWATWSIITQSKNTRVPPI